MSGLIPDPPPVDPRDWGPVVLANMAFNLGVDGLLGFRRMILAVDRGHYDQAAREMLNSKWARQVFNRAIRLAEMMAKG